MPSSLHHPVIDHDPADRTTAPLTDLQGPLAYWGPPPPAARRPPPAGDHAAATDAAAVHAWVRQLRAREAGFARAAAAAGVALAPLDEAECRAAAHLAVALGLAPAAPLGRVLALALAAR
jgi:hypothetical protein